MSRKKSFSEKETGKGLDFHARAGTFFDLYFFHKDKNHNLNKKQEKKDKSQKCLNQSN